MTTQSPDAHPATATSRPVEVIGEFADYAGAQRLVDRLSDAEFPVETVRIVGTGLRTVEEVTGRLTKGRAALVGAGGGAWFGLLIGLLLGLFTVSAAWFALIVTALLMGVLWGALFGFLTHLATRGRRDFSSVKSLQAERYQVQVDAPMAAEAARLADVSSR